MSNSKAKTTPAAGVKGAAKKTTEPKAHKPDHQEVIYNILKAHDGKYPLDRIETAAQAIKKASGGSYTHSAKLNFVIDKEGNILAQPAEQGMKVHLLYLQKRKVAKTTFMLKTFPKEAAEVAKKFNIKIPTPKS